MATCFSPTAMLSPSPTARRSTSYPTPRTQSTAKMLTQLKSLSNHSSLGNEVSPASTSGSISRPFHPKYTFTEEEDRVEDKALHFLDRTGHLSQVAGSQSVLSQELLSVDDQESQQASQISTFSAKSPEAVARRYGILTQEMVEDDNQSTSTKTTKQSDSFQTPPRAAAKTRKVVTAQNSRKISADENMQSSTLEDNAMNETQPSLTFSQLEEAVADLGSHVSVNSTNFVLENASSNTKRRSSLSSTDQKIPAKRKSTKIQADESEADPPRKKAKKQLTEEYNYAAIGNEAVSGEIQWVGSNSKRRGADKHEQDLAKEAAEVARRIIDGENDLAKKLLLSMALQRDSPRNPPSNLPPKGPIPEGFVWAHYPPLEAVLKEHMAEYYELSMAKCQSTKQQLFNNNLVDRMRDVAAAHGYSFPTDRRTLRDRIRCYYKTHIQNAKKRLRTCLRNPTKKANARNLAKLMEFLPDEVTTSNQSKVDSKQERSVDDSDETESKKDIVV